MQRALAAYYKHDVDLTAAWPVKSRCLHCVVGGLEYVKLANASRTLAVFRVRTFDGMLKRMKRWPAALDDL